jgi:hypothetical protein
MEVNAPAPVPRCHSIAPTTGTSKAPTNRSYATLIAAITLFMRQAAAVIRAPNTNVTILLCATEPVFPEPRRRKYTSSSDTVEAASRQALAVDIIAASEAAAACGLDAPGRASVTM